MFATSNNDLGLCNSDGVDIHSQTRQLLNLLPRPTAITPTRTTLGSKQTYTLNIAQIYFYVVQ